MMLQRCRNTADIPTDNKIRQHWGVYTVSFCSHTFRFEKLATARTGNQ